jgi:hypothetical protein
VVRLIHREIKETEMQALKIVGIGLLGGITSAIVVAELNGVTVHRFAWWFIQTIVYAGAR